MNSERKLTKAMNEGQVYRRSHLFGASRSVDRDLKALVSKGEIKKVGPGLYLRPAKTRFGTAPPSDRELVRSFLKTDDFLLTTFSHFNALGFGLTQVYNQTLVYNHKRRGKFQLGGRKFEFRIVPEYPKELSKEYLVVDMLNNLKRLPDNTELVEQSLAQGIANFNLPNLRDSKDKYGSPFAKRKLEALNV